MKYADAHNMKQAAAEGLQALSNGTGPAAGRKAWTGKLVDALTAENGDVSLVAAAFALREVMDSGSTERLPEHAARVVQDAARLRMLTGEGAGQ